MEDKLFSIYKNMPAFLQNVAVSLQGYRIRRRRFGEGFEEKLSRATGRLSGDGKALHELRREWLSEHLRIASESEFWRRRFHKHGVKPNGEEPFCEIQKLPCLRKSEFKNTPSEILPDGLETGDLLDRHTSGTTGSGLQFWETVESEQEQWAVWWRYCRWHGIDRTDWCGCFGGRQVVDTKTDSPPYWRYNLPGRQVMFSNYHIAPATAGDYIEAIRRWELPWIHGYRSSIALLVQLMLEQNLSAPESVRVVTISYERG